ncbi:MAG: peptidylprolyl isomerase [Oligoflexia bacterium]|nr:peptidylprolyl isomerase [Oligoflexia bacterium]
MKKQNVVSIHYTLKDKSGTVVDSSDGREPLSYLEGAGNIIPGLESQLKDLPVGTKKKVTVPAKDAYGETRADLIMSVPRTQFPADLKIKVGDHFRTGPEAHAPVFMVQKIEDDSIVLDGNHPMAGKELFFDIEIISVREASAEEQAHGHAHGPGGHHHH